MGVWLRVKAHFHYGCALHCVAWWEIQRHGVTDSVSYFYHHATPCNNTHNRRNGNKPLSKHSARQWVERRWLKILWTWNPYLSILVGPHMRSSYHATWQATWQEVSSWLAVNSRLTVDRSFLARLTGYKKWAVLTTLHLTHSFIHFWHAVPMHHYECVAPDVDISLQSGRLWATSIASFREWFIDFRSCWVVFIHVVRGVT